jgi:pyruvate formate lyase activating enzyme
MESTGPVIETKYCNSCGLCIDACPLGNYSFICRRYSAGELAVELLKDDVFYSTSGGGVTFSGGEPLIHIDFLLRISGILKKKGIHIAIETCGDVEKRIMEKATGIADLLLYDLKMLDTARHKALTGRPVDRVMENLLLLSGSGSPFIIRLPLIPGINDGQDIINRLELASSLKNVKQVDLLKYHRLGKGKYLQLNMDYLMSSIDNNINWKAIDKELYELKIYGESLGLKVTIGG